jgi:hypothetical protein
LTFRLVSHSLFKRNKQFNEKVIEGGSQLWTRQQTSAQNAGRLLRLYA